MKHLKIIPETKLYPITFKGKKYTRKNTNTTFMAYYTSPHSLLPDTSVYVGEDTYVYPDGTFR